MATRAKRRDRIMSMIGGDPRRVADELRAFRRSSRTLSSESPRLIAEYPKKWVGIYDGRVQVATKTFPALIAALQRRKLPREHVIIRYIDKDERIMIL